MMPVFFPFCLDPLSFFKEGADWEGLGPLLFGLLLWKFYFLGGLDFYFCWDNKAFPDVSSDLPKWVFLEQTEMVFGETKTISKWKRCSGHNGIAPMGHKCTKNLEPETLSKFRQHRFQILIKTESGASYKLGYHVRVHRVLPKGQTLWATASYK